MSSLQPRGIQFFIPGTIFGFALLLRFIFIFQWHATPYGDAPLWDAAAYHQWAQDIAQGHLWRDKAFYSFPLFPYLLGGLYALFGHNLWVASVFNAVLDAATCALLARLAQILFGTGAGVWTGILAALYAPMIFFTAPVMKEPLGLFLLALALLTSCRALRKNTGRDFFVGGLCLGLATLVRGNVLALAIIVPVVLIKKFKTRARREIAFYLLGVALAIAPVTLHNFIVSRDFVPISYAGGFNAYIGHGPVATGTSYEFPPGIVDEEYDTTRIASAALGHPAKPSEVSAYWQKQAFDYAITHPGREIRMLGDRITAFWSDAEPFDNYDMRFIAHHFSTLLALPLPGFGVAAMLAVFAIIGATQRKAVFGLAIAALLYMLSLFPFYVTTRYRLPVVVFLLPLAGAGIVAGHRMVKTRDIRKLGPAACGVLVMSLATFWPHARDTVDEAYDWGVIASLAEDEGHPVDCLQAFDRAMALNAAAVGPDVWIKAADAKAHIGSGSEAVQMLEKAMTLFPADGSVSYNYGRFKLMAGDEDAALGAFEKAVRQTPTFLLGYRGLAAVYDRRGDRAKAVQTIEQGLAIAPADKGLNETLAHLRQR